MFFCTNTSRQRNTPHQKKNKLKKLISGHRERSFSRNSIFGVLPLSVVASNFISYHFRALFYFYFHFLDTFWTCFFFPLSCSILPPVRFACIWGQNSFRCKRLTNVPWHIKLLPSTSDMYQTSENSHYDVRKTWTSLELRQHL